MDKKKSPSPMKERRRQRLGEELRKILTMQLRSAKKIDPQLPETPIIITEVVLSPDLSHGRVYFMPLAGIGDIKAIEKILNNNIGAMRKIIGKTLHIRYVPKLIFAEDTTFAASKRIDDLLKS